MILGLRNKCRFYVNCQIVTARTKLNKRYMYKAVAFFSVLFDIAANPNQL